MSGFKTDLVTREYDEQKGQDQLVEPFVYQSDLLGRDVVVPAGFITDWASVPRLPLAYLLLGGKGKRAALVHDWLYKTQCVDRQTADATFREALAASDYGALTRGAFWLGVRVGGWVAWDEHRRENIAQPEHVVAAMDRESA